MQHLRVVRRFALALAIVMSGVAPAFAQSSPQSVREPAVLNVKGPAGCVDAGAIERQVHERSRRIEFVPAGGVVPVLNVRVERPTPRSVAVELSVSWPDERRSRRKLAADGCEEATSAVAFLIALTLDPAAFGRPGASAAVAERSGDQPAATPAAAEAAGRAARDSHASAARGGP